VIAEEVEPGWDVLLIYSTTDAEGRGSGPWCTVSTVQGTGARHIQVVNVEINVVTL